MKIPKYVYEETLAFYRDILGFKLLKEESDFIQNAIAVSIDRSRYGLTGWIIMHRLMYGWI